MRVIRKNGFFVDRDETIGFTAIAAPVFDRTGIIGAIGLAGTTFKMAETLPELIRQTVDTARHISKRLGHLPHPPPHKKCLLFHFINALYKIRRFFLLGMEKPLLRLICQLPSIVKIPSL
ncbi:IclR family transcriptional regulator domain-containing protein [Geobacillus sp. YF-1]|uniref:IclR family transcriptional regulator domain-containing protein n=1 Tax=Geobacillus sp. YF-1 TaxID=3457480 RepID=UPI0040453C0B